MAQRSRSAFLGFWVSEEERNIIQQKMALAGISSTSAYLRKMAMDGYTVKLDMPELKEMVSLLRYAGNNLNQYTKRAHETGRIYDADLEDIRNNQERIWDSASAILKKLSSVA